MKNSKKDSQYAIKRKLAAAVAMLLISCVMLTTVSYAWLIMSIAPEVTGITTNVGANGSLEIALLDENTRQDLTKIKTAVGKTVSNNPLAANRTWGNLVDLSHEDYGLNNIFLMPARVNLAQRDDKYVIDGSSMLSVPVYDYDGRVVRLESDGTFSAVFKDQKFAEEGYGVRAIGTSLDGNAQSNALKNAKSNVTKHTNNAKSTAINAIDKNGNGLMNILLTHSVSSTATHGENDLSALKSIIIDLNSSLEYVESALRQGVIAVLASQMDNVDEFVEARDLVNSDVPLSTVLNQLTFGNADKLGEFYGWATSLEALQSDLNDALFTCNSYSGGSYTWDQLKDVMNLLMDLNGIYIDDKLFAEMEGSELSGLMGKSFTVTLASGSGVFASLADFTGDYSTWISVVGSDVEIKTLTTVTPPHLLGLAEDIKDLTAAGGGATGSGSSTLSTTYGYAIDLAFRCNAQISSLLLQTDATSRIDKNSTASGTMGGGSYMEFISAKDVSVGQTIALMDAVRVAFIDDQDVVLGIAKLNTSNRIILDNGVKAPLYLYDYSISEEEETEGALIMGERRKFDNTIVDLTQSVAKAVTVLVWLDGDIVDNTMVSAESETSLSGILNLQFASSADLVPLKNNDLLNLEANKESLDLTLNSCKTKVEAGQGMYTTESWESFIAAYNYAKAISDNNDSVQSQIYRANVLLRQAENGLEEAKLETLGEKIAEIRELMGSSDDIARYVLHNSETGEYSSVDPYTEEQKENKVGEIFRVDYENNILEKGSSMIDEEEGNESGSEEEDDVAGVKTTIYTDASWSNLAAALYDAELVYTFVKPTEYHIYDEAITNLTKAYEALQNNVFFMPYDLDGELYYKAIPLDPKDTDTYGKWYYSNLVRVVADLTVLKLDTHAIPATIAEMDQESYINNNQQIISPFVEILNELYPELTDEEILAIQWNINDKLDNKLVKMISDNQKAYLADLIERARKLTIEATTEIDNAQEILNKSKDNTVNMATEAEAIEVIIALETKVLAEEKRLSELENEEDPAKPMTAEWRFVLTEAVKAAKAVEGYDTDENLADLKTAAEAIELLLNQTAPEGTGAQAETALDELNTLLKAAGEKEVTKHNTILHYLPIGSEMFEIVHTKDYANVMLKTTGETGEVELEAIILTRSGIVVTLKKTITIYAKANGVELIHPETAPTGGTIVPNEDTESLNENVWDGKIKVGAETSISVELLQATFEEEGEKIKYSHGEEIKECKWVVPNSEALLCEKDKTNSCNIKAVKKGFTQLHVTVITVQGNTYVAEMTIEITE